MVGISGVTAIIGAQWGSEAKGVVAAKIAHKFHAAVRTGGPNAGHSLRYAGRTYKMRSVPCAWVNPDAWLIIGPGAEVKRELLIHEIESLPPRIMYLDPRAIIITHAMELAEQRLIGKIGSTAEGVGQARMARIARDPNGEPVLARDYVWPPAVIVQDTVPLLFDLLNSGRAVMLEGTQGSGLSIYSDSWPKVTSRDTNVAGFLSEAGIAPYFLSHTLLVARSYPIRVGGNSGQMGRELDWSVIPGHPTPETTTVTGRQRRIAIWDDVVFRDAIIRNHPCGVVLSFGDYLDPSIAGTTSYADIASSAPIKAMVNKIESDFDVPVIAVGTGGPEWEYVGIETCSHGERWLQ